MLIFINVINPTNLTKMSDLTSEFHETSNTTLLKKAAQDRGPFWFSYILSEMFQYIDIWNDFKV